MTKLKPIARHREAHWQSYRRLPAYIVPARWRHWLLDRGSLTQRLLAASAGQFRVRVLSQTIAKPRRTEAQALGIPSQHLAVVREVVLYGNDQPWVYARSILPLSSLTGRLARLRKLDERPLGAILFADPSMRRGKLELARVLPARVALPPQLGIFDTPLWGRRSVFYIADKPLLVSEIFLPTFSPANTVPNDLSGHH
ncbi:MAG: chorismate lyase [Gammaproteobacteria bacterium]|nr:chorismate lyase [Gammaproteobacteria bacterium]MBQ0839302.1 chorismate lyase [Gammaproteobacteria bacterium]